MYSRRIGKKYLTSSTYFWCKRFGRIMIGNMVALCSSRKEYTIMEVKCRTFSFSSQNKKQVLIISLEFYLSAKHQMILTELLILTAFRNSDWQLAYQIAFGKKFRGDLRFIGYELRRSLGY